MAALGVSARNARRLGNISRRVADLMRAFMLHSSKCAAASGRTRQGVPSPLQGLPGFNRLGSPPAMCVHSQPNAPPPRVEEMYDIHLLPPK